MLPVVLFKSAAKPVAVLKLPVVRLRSALSPSAVLKPEEAPSGAGVTPKAFGAGQNAKHTSTSGTSRARPAVEGLIEFVNCEVIIFFSLCVQVSVQLDLLIA